MSDVILNLGGSGGGASSDDCTADKSKVLSGYTAVTSDSEDEAVTGTMKNLSAESSITHTSDNETKVILGDACWTVENSDGVTRSEIRYNGNEGYITPNTLFAIDSSVSGVSADKIAKNQTIMGCEGTYTSDATADSNCLLQNYTAYANGVKIEGAMTDVPSEDMYKTLVDNGNGYACIGMTNGAHIRNQERGFPEVTVPLAAFGTATAENVLSGNTFTSISGVFTSGTMVNNGGSTTNISNCYKYTDNSGNSWLIEWIPGGYYNGWQTKDNNYYAETWLSWDRFKAFISSTLSFELAATSPTTIRVNWTNPSQGAWSGLKIYISTNSSMSGAWLAYQGSGENGYQAGGSNYHDITGLNANTTYYIYFINYIDASGIILNGETSNTKSVNTSSWINNLDTYLNDVDNTFKNLVLTNSAAVGDIASSASALQKIAKNAQACFYMNLSQYTPNYYDTIANTLANSSSFTSSSFTGDNVTSYRQSSGSGWTETWLGTTSSSGYTKITNKSSSDPTPATGKIILISSYKCGGKGKTNPSSSVYSLFCGNIIHGRSGGSYTNNGYTIDPPMIFRHGWNFGVETERNNYEGAGLRASYDNRYIVWRSVTDGPVSFTRNIICFGCASCETQFHDDENTYAYGYWNGKIYTAT